jgi:hypothetical protein
MSAQPALVEFPCDVCVRAMFHRLVRGEWTCTACGTRRSPPPEQTYLEPPTQVPSRTTESVSAVTERLEQPQPYSEPEPPQPYSEPQTYSEPQERLSGEGLRAWDRRDDFARWVCALAGLRFEVDEEQRIDLGGRGLRVSLWRAEDGLWIIRLYEGWPETKRTSLSLTETFAAAVTGKLRVLDDSEYAVWKLRALVGCGQLDPAPVALADLPANAPPSAIETWALARHLLSVRWLREPGAPVPLSAPWLEAWSGGRVTVSTIVSGKRWLERRGFIEHVENAPGSGGHPLFLWRVRQAVS